MKKSTDQFIKQSSLIHNNRYSYEKTDYINRTDHVIITCPIHGDFNQRPKLHLLGMGCKKCKPEKIKTTNLERYGVDNVSQLESIKQQKNITNLQKNGHINPAQGNKAKQKIKQTNLQKFGTQHPMQSDVIQEKTKRTNKQRLGVEFPIQQLEIREKIKQINQQLYDVNYHTQKHLQYQMQFITYRNWLCDQYMVKNKTITQIAAELQTTTATLSRYIKQFDIPIRYKNQYSYKCISWLNDIMSNFNIHIQHALNGGEYKIPNSNYRVDGYCLETNTIYEFYGDRFHGNPQLFLPTDKCHPFNKEITAQELYEQTKTREQYLIDLGYQLITIWEFDYK